MEVLQKELLKYRIQVGGFSILPFGLRLNIYYAYPEGWRQVGYVVGLLGKLEGEIKIPVPGLWVKFSNGEWQISKLGG